MSGALSGHLVESYMLAQTPRGPFGQSTPQIATSGAMAFAPSMHGNFPSQMSTMPSMFDQSAFMELSEGTALKIAELQAKLNKKLGPEYISQRPGPAGGPKLTYAEGWKIINLANEVFGFNGWSSSVVNLTTDFIDFSEESKRFNVGVTAVVRVTLRDGVYHEDIGYGMLENSRSKGAALDKCKKEAVTDGVKRALRNFGNLLGNCLYDKSYTQEIVKIRVPPPKFDKDDLHRRPEFAEPKPPLQSNPSSSTASNTTTVVKSEPQQLVPGASKPPMPPHMRSNTSNLVTPSRPPTGNVTNMPKPVSNIGLNTPITPANLNANRPATSRPPMNAPQFQSKPQPPPQAQSKPHPPAPQQPQQQPRPPQAPPPVEKEEPQDSIFSASQDEYDFGYDDELFASVDLEALGDAGIGGHIDFDEGSGGVSAIEDDVSMQMQPAPPAQTRQQQVAQPPRPQQQRPQQQQKQPQPGAPPGRSRAEILAEYERDRLAELERQKLQQQASSSTGTTASAGSTPGPSSTPTMGGFNFPPNVNFNRGNGHTAQGQGSSRVGGSNLGSNSSGVGLKRTFDSAQGSSAQQRRPFQGMGLAQASSSSAKREPLGNLDIGESGDVKRARR